MTNLPAQVEVPEIWYKTQRVLRTITAALVALVPIVNGVAYAVVVYLNSQEEVGIPPWVFVWLNAIIAGTALIMGLVTRIMAVPGVNDWLTKLGLGSVPKDALTPVRQASNGATTVAVKPDPKVNDVPLGG